MTSRIVNAKKLYEKGLTHEVNPIPNVRGAIQYKVKSGASRRLYVVTLSESHRGKPPIRSVTGTCTCSWGDFRLSANGFVSGCSHVIAAIRFLLMSEHSLTISAWADIEQALRQHRITLRSGDGLTVTARKASARQVAGFERDTGRDMRDVALPVEYSRGRSKLFKD